MKLLRLIEHADLRFHGRSLTIYDVAALYVAAGGAVAVFGVRRLQAPLLPRAEAT
jgi:hypothetical protein